MQLRTELAALLLAACVLPCPACSPASARADDDPAHPAVELEPVSTTCFGERVLVFLEHPPLVRGEKARFLAHFSVLATGEPIRAGRVLLTIGSATFTVDAPKRDGLFIPEGAIDAAGRFPARIVVASAQAEETLDLGEVVVHASTHDAARAAQADAAEDPPGAVPFLLEQQWKIGLLVQAAGPRALARRVLAPAEVRTPEGREVLVTPPISGRLHPPTNGALPRTGERVEPGAVLAEIEPLLGAVDQAGMQKLELEFDLEGLRVVRAASEAAVRLDFARRERDRIARLRERGLGTAQELEGAERALAVAASEDEGARATKAYLDERASVRARFGTGANARVPVLAPIGGAVIEAARVSGETLGAGDEFLRLRDTSRVWIEGRASEFDLHLLGPGSTAVATFAGLPERRIEIGPETGGLVLLPTIDTESRTVRVRCEVANADGALRAGMMAELAIAAETVAASVAVPEAAIVMDQGLATAYVMLEGELFQKRELELGVKDGGWVEVQRGLAAGERVATRGAYIVRLAALSPASFGAGHQH